MDTIFIGVTDKSEKTILREMALKFFYIDKYSKDIEIKEYIYQPESYFLAETPNAQIKFYQSPHQPEPYKIEYVYHSGEKAASVIMKCYDEWIFEIWNKLSDPEMMRDEKLKLVIE